MQKSQDELHPVVDVLLTLLFSSDTIGPIQVLPSQYKVIEGRHLMHRPFMQCHSVFYQM